MWPTQSERYDFYIHNHAVMYCFRESLRYDFFRHLDRRGTTGVGMMMVSDFVFDLSSRTMLKNRIMGPNENAYDTMVALMLLNNPLVPFGTRMVSV